MPGSTRLRSGFLRADKVQAGTVLPRRPRIAAALRCGSTGPNGRSSVRGSEKIGVTFAVSSLPSVPSLSGRPKTSVPRHQTFGVPGRIAMESASSTCTTGEASPVPAFERRSRVTTAPSIVSLPARRAPLDLPLRIPGSASSPSGHERRHAVGLRRRGEAGTGSGCGAFPQSAPPQFTFFQNRHDVKRLRLGLGADVWLR